MKAPRATCEGYLTLRTSPSSPPPMLRRYCFLVGTALYYYSTQEDAYHMLRLKGQVDVLGAQDWDGKGNMHIYQHGFLFATAQSKVFYAYADTAMDKEKWMRAIQTTVVTTMPRRPTSWMHPLAGTSTTDTSGNKRGGGGRTSSSSTTHGGRGSRNSSGGNGNGSGNSSNNSSSTSLVAIGESTSPIGGAVPVNEADGVTCKCPLCKTSATQTPPPPPATMLYPCHNCDALYCEKFTTGKIPLPHRDYYDAKRVCDRCLESQMFLNYLRAMSERLKAGICLYPRALNPDTPIELLMPKRPMHTEAANIAINMLKMGRITAEECEEILLADRRFLDHTVDHPEIPLDLKILGLHREFRSRSFGVYRAVILLHRHLDSDPLLFKPIVERLLHFSYTRINQVEFYWPQIVHAYLTVPMFDFEKIFWLDELILSICTRSIHLALLLRWQLQGALEDSFDLYAPKEMQDKYARVVRLMVEMEQEVVGTPLSAILRHDDTAKVHNPNRLPIPSTEQLSLIDKLSKEIAQYRAQANASSSSLSTTTPDDGNERPPSTYPHCQRSSISTATMRIPLPQNGELSPVSGEVASDSRFREFSRFQQHLLTPKEDFGMMLPVDDSEVRPHAASLEDEEHAQPTSLFTVGGPANRMSSAEKSVLAQHFADECDFVEQITDISEALRFVPSVPERKKLLPSYLETLRLPPMAYVPLVKATDPFERIVRIPTKEGTAFSTKARVPIMLIFEVIRGNPFNSEPLLSPTSPNRRSGYGSGVIPDAGLEYVEDEEVGRLLSHQESVHGLSAGVGDDVSGETEAMAAEAEADADAAAAAEIDADAGTEAEADTEAEAAQSGVQGDAPQPTARRFSLVAPETPADVEGGMVTPMPGIAQVDAGNLPLRTPPAELESEGMPPSTMAGEPAAVDSGDSKAVSVPPVLPPHALRHQSRSITDPDTKTIEVSSSADLTEEAVQREMDRRKDLEAAFGESWSSRRKRMRESSPFGHLPGWDIVSMLGKSNDDLRQEVFTLQLIQKFIEIFKLAQLPIWLKSYRIIATSSSTGLIETLVNAISLDGLKKRDGYVSLLHHFQKSYGPVDSPRFLEARRKYIESMAGYSLVAYFLQIKDRHNGNIMLDNEGHIIHIDYGFLLGIAPGGSFSIETAPFKLTVEMVDTMGGPDSDGFNEYVKLCTRGFLACQKHVDEICDLVSIMAPQSPYPCFVGKSVTYKLRERFKLNLSKEDTVAYVLSLIRRSHGNYSTRQYDNFQRMTNGILP